MLILNDIDLKKEIQKYVKNDNRKTAFYFRMFLMEKILEKISLSKYKENFILKGGLLIVSLTNLDLRATKDIDGTLKFENSINENEMRKILEDIINVDLKESDVKTLIKIQKIEKCIIASLFDGFSINLNVEFGKINSVINLDIACGGVITPKHIKHQYITILDKRKINIFSYNVESVIAEKISAILQWGIENTRLKDFYDIYLLNETQNIDFKILKQAIHNCLKERKMEYLIKNYTKIFHTIKKSENMKKRWNNYVKINYFVTQKRWDFILFIIEDILNKAI